MLYWRSIVFHLWRQFGHHEVLKAAKVQCYDFLAFLAGTLHKTSKIIVNDSGEEIEFVFKTAQNSQLCNKDFIFLKWLFVQLPLTIEYDLLCNMEKYWLINKKESIPEYYEYETATLL